jgi:hypothetical protein
MQLIQTNLNAIDGAFCSAEEKKRLSCMVGCYGASKGLDLECCGEDEQRSWKRAESDGYFSDRVYLASKKL